MSHASPPERPWYCSDRMVDDWVTVERQGGDLKMLKGLKILRSIIVNLGVIGISLFALTEGADPTLVGLGALLVLGGYNGVEAADCAALAQAIAEVQTASEDTGDEGGDS